MRRWVAALLLLAPFAAVPPLVEWQAERQAARLGQGLSVLGGAVRFAELQRQERARAEVGRWRAQLDSLWDEARISDVATKQAPARQQPTKQATRRGLYVSAEKVLSLAQSGARPSGIAVAPAAGRPGGLMLIGVSGLGVGLRDGDILTHALGQPAVSEAAVIAAVARARGARLARLGGRLWRDGRSFSLVVAQPYLDPG